jgi:uncharacterized protein
MQKNILLKVLPHEAADEKILQKQVSQFCGVPHTSVSGFNILKKSIDARGKQVYIQLSLLVYINEPVSRENKQEFIFRNVKKAEQRVIIIGAGPAGLFAAIKLIEAGIQPIILERGKDVKARRRDLAILNKEGIVNPESNYCFGEGGAGAYSDGKLYTRSSKRGDVSRILNLLVYFGADNKILYEAHPHIGTNKLPQIITALRKMILEYGGEIHFETRAIDFILKQNKISSVKTADGNLFEADAVILATGHSAKDIFILLESKKILIEPKPFALGVRVEHPQSIIDSAQYHCRVRDAFLPPSSYSLVQQVGGRGVFSFCMCPGGIIAPAATNPGELVVNGWSPSKRNNPYANSGMVVQVDLKDVFNLNKKDKLKIKNAENPLALMYFQEAVEKKAFGAGGGLFVAPAQRLADFTNNKLSSSLPDCSYLPGVNSVELENVLPHFIYQNLQRAFKEFGKKMRGYFTNDAIVVATESRTSSPVRIPRNPDTLQHPQINNLYPCGEGAGYAGGIASAAMDGEKCAAMISKHIIA